MGADDVVALIGQAMLAVAAALVAIGLALSVPRVLRVRRRALALQATVRALDRERLMALLRLQAQLAETDALLVPWRRVLRWARHPLVIAALDWYGRRRRRSRG